MTIRALAFLLALVAVVPAGAEPLRVLFVGNSHTYVNNVPGFVRAVALAARPDAPPPEIEMLVGPGTVLNDFVENDILRDVLAREDFDVVVLQERGGVLGCMTSAQRPPPSDCTQIVNAHRKLAKLVIADGARLLLYGTWGNRPSPQGPISRGLRMVAGRVHAEAVDVGVAVERAMKDPAVPALLDGTDHLTRAGALLAGAMLWRSIAGVELPAGPFRAEVPIWPPQSRFNRFGFASVQKKLPKPDLATVEFDAAQVAALQRAMPPRAAR